MVFLTADLRGSSRYFVVVAQTFCQNPLLMPCFTYTLILFFFSFNFPTASTTLTAAVTHLARQNYQICIRRGINFCYICYTPNITPTTAVITQQSFGLS